MIALSRSSTKLTVRNDVMDLLMTLFLPACSVNEVLGINDAVQNVFTFFSSFRNTPSRNPQRVGAGCTKPVTAPTNLAGKRINHSSHILGYSSGIVAFVHQSKQIPGKTLTSQKLACS
ncbi:hypothetical protein BASA50_007566 [Batrachochytrium salamandrivorans]|uniref:Uncharacterized protein n=1 Tax=Batrachochytrium salamandrivorans TaxID=1357716 RepID=A0ABQ8F739_9FUNG|nr:hypothetical protein BASA50_007566 [Batrachochytrium salamandrivorans]